MNLLINGVKVKFKKYEQENKEIRAKFKELVDCDEKGKELEYKSGNRGYYVYKDSGERYNGTKTYKLEDGKVKEMTARTKELTFEDFKVVDRKVLNAFPIISEEFCVIGEAIFGGRLDKDVLVVPIQQTDSYEYNTKIGIIYKDVDGVVTLRLCSMTPKNKQRSGVNVSRAVNKLESNKLMKKASLDAIGVKI